MTPAPQRTQKYYCATISTTELNLITYSILTGLFPVQSSLGLQYILVVYDYDSNSILMEPMKNHSDTEMVWAHTTIFNHLQHAGFHHIIQCLDNEASTASKTWMHGCNIQFQLVPPHVHCWNAAE